MVVNRFTTSRTLPFPVTLHLEIGLAHSRMLELAAKDRELHFTSDAAGRLVVELRTLDGRLLSTVSPRLALDIISGADLDSALRAAAPHEEAPPTPPQAA